MRSGNQVISRAGDTSDLAPIPSGARVRIDPRLLKNGVRVRPNWVWVSLGFLATINPDGTFDAQNISAADLVCSWFATFEHSIQHDQDQALQTDLGPLGVFPSPAPPIIIEAGLVEYDDTAILPQYGNPIPVNFVNQALDANKKAIRRLVFRPNLPTSTPPAPNTFTNWTDLYAAYQAQANAGACQIVFEAEGPIIAPITIPPGTWEFQYGDSFEGAALGPQIQVNLADGCQIKNVYLFNNGLLLVGETTGAPQLVWDSLLGTGAPLVPIFQNAAVVVNNGSAAMIVWDQPDNENFLGIGLGFASRFESGAFEILELQDPGGGFPATVQFFMQGGGANLGPNTIRGAGNVGYRVELNAQGVNVSLEQTNYTGLPVVPPGTFAQRAHRRLILTEQLDNGATRTLEPSEFALIAPTLEPGDPIEITLPSAAFFPSIVCGGKRIAGALGSTPVSFTTGGELIEGAPPPYVLPAVPFAGVQFFSDGANWFVLP